MEGTPDERRHLAATFDTVPDGYHRARPAYPSSLFDRLLVVTGLTPSARVLEIGCATGTATRPMAERGFAVTCIERGPALAAAARRSLADLDVDVRVGEFEEFSGDAPYDLVFAATAWHWIDPAVRYGKAAELLRAGGHLAFWSATHVFPPGGDDFFYELQPVYDAIGQGVPGGASYPAPGELPDERVQIEASGRFDVVDVSHFDWETTYDADGYIDLLNTFSGHIAMAKWQRQRLYDEIRARLSARSGASLRRHWGAVLHVARRQ